MDIQQTNQE